MRQINILGYRYTIDLTNKLEDMKGNVGYCNFDKQTLQVANDVAVDTINSTLLHEIFEAINFHLEIGLNEAQIKQFEVGLHQVLKDAGVPIDRLASQL
jgi:hypothetical protein